MKLLAAIPAFVTVLFLGACTVIGHQKVEGWPKLTVIEHYVPHYQMRDRCVQYTAFGMSPEACAEFNLEKHTCDLWFSADFPPPKSFVDHERMHCDGYDHIGETSMRDFLANYNAATRALTLAKQQQGQSVR